MSVTINTTAKWEPLKMADLLRLLQPVESSWKTLGRYLLRDEVQHKLATIESNCFHNNASKIALDDVLNKWLECTVGAKRTWQTLCDVAKKYGDDSLKKYVEANSLTSEYFYICGICTHCLCLYLL